MAVYTLSVWTFPAATGNFTTRVTSGSGYVATTKDRTQYLFDSQGRLSTVSDPNGNTLTTSRNSSGRLLSVADAGGRSLSFSYNSNGNLDFVAGPIGQRTTFGYDTAVHLASVTDPTAATVTDTYDDKGRILHAVDEHGLADLVHGHGLVEFDDHLDGAGLQRLPKMRHQLHVAEPGVERPVLPPHRHSVQPDIGR